mmetsp:Transcript_10717/g.30141  ORF Transcript_10717/g.30141 Transcript_10717/m.30141 type:complete len:261 (+) Transcript_10717:625-1407(+)
MRLWSLHDLHITHGSKFDCQIGERIGRSVDEEDLQANVIVADSNQSLGVDGVGETTERIDMAELIFQKGSAIDVAGGTGKVGSIVEVHVAHLDGHGLELSEVDEIIGLSHGRLGLVLLGIRGLLVLDLLKEGAEALATLGEHERLEQLGGLGIKERSAAQGQTILAIGEAGFLRRGVDLGHLDDAAHDEDGLSGHGLDLNGANLWKVRRTEAQLGESGGHNGAKEDVAAEEHLAKAGSRVINDGLLRLIVHSLSGVRAIR